MQNESTKAQLLESFRKISDWLYGGDKEAPDIRCRSVMAVVIRLPQKCCTPYHRRPKKYPRGTLMIVERAVIDGEWRSCYTCRRCVEKSLNELGLLPKGLNP